MTAPAIRVVSWNVNSVRARQERIVAWLERNEPDIVLLQETRCADGAFESPDLAGRYRSMGYAVAHHGRDQWNGVAVLSRIGLEDVQRGFVGINRAPYDEARVLAATCAGIRVWSVYAPNGRELDDPHYLFKLVWFERLRAALAAPGDGLPVVVAGDLNVAPTDDDIYEPQRWRRRTHASPPERAAIRDLLDLGLGDVTRHHLPGPGVFTWWSYRPGQFERNRGLRIDLALCSPAVADRVERVWIDVDERAGPGASDHAPLVLELADDTR
jgi:exodeoxyribonuclease-3